MDSSVKHRSRPCLIHRNIGKSVKIVCIIISIGAGVKTNSRKRKERRKTGPGKIWENIYKQEWWNGGRTEVDAKEEGREAEEWKLAF